MNDLVKNLEQMYLDMGSSKRKCKHTKAKVNYSLDLQCYKFYCPSCRRLGYANKVAAETLGWIKTKISKPTNITNQLKKQN